MCLLLPAFELTLNCLLQRTNQRCDSASESSEGQFLYHLRGKEPEVATQEPVEKQVCRSHGPRARAQQESHTACKCPSEKWWLWHQQVHPCWIPPQRITQSNQIWEKVKAGHSEVVLNISVWRGVYRLCDSFSRDIKSQGTCGICHLDVSEPPELSYPSSFWLHLSCYVCDVGSWETEYWNLLPHFCSVFVFGFCVHQRVLKEGSPSEEVCADRPLQSRMSTTDVRWAHGESTSNVVTSTGRHENIYYFWQIMLKWLHFPGLRNDSKNLLSERQKKRNDAWLYRLQNIP